MENCCRWHFYPTVLFAACVCAVSLPSIAIRVLSFSSFQLRYGAYGYGRIRFTYAFVCNEHTLQCNATKCKRVPHCGTYRAVERVKLIKINHRDFFRFILCTLCDKQDNAPKIFLSTRFPAFPYGQGRQNIVANFSHNRVSHFRARCDDLFFKSNQSNLVLGIWSAFFIGSPWVEFSCLTIFRWWWWWCCWWCSCVVCMGWR